MAISANSKSLRLIFGSLLQTSRSIAASFERESISACSVKTSPLDELIKTVSGLIFEKTFDLECEARSYERLLKDKRIEKEKIIRCFESK